jgi:high frequency lysogenization protein
MSLNPRLRDRTIAISAVVQAASLVQQVAETGQVNSADMKVMLESLLVENAPDTESVYGSVSQLRTGIDALNTQLSKKKRQKRCDLITLCHQSSSP